MEVNEEEFYKVEAKFEDGWQRNHQKHNDVISAEHACSVFKNARDVHDTRVIKIRKKSGRTEEIVSSPR